MFLQYVKEDEKYVSATEHLEFSTTEFTAC